MRPKLSELLFLTAMILAVGLAVILHASVGGPAYAAGVEVASRPSMVESRPTCLFARRGTLWVDYGLTAGTADRLEICTQTTGAALGWRAVQLVAGTSLSSVIVSNANAQAALP